MTVPEGNVTRRGGGLAAELIFPVEKAQEWHLKGGERRGTALVRQAVPNLENQVGPEAHVWGVCFQ